MNSEYPKIIFPKKRHFVQFSDAEGNVYWMCLTEKELSKNKLANDAYFMSGLIDRLRSSGCDGFIATNMIEEYENRFERATA